jgi:hypothetical protein
MKWVGPKILRKFLVEIGGLSPDPKNSRSHDEKNIQTIVESFQKNGQVQLLVVYDGEVCAGNARLEAALRLGWSHLAVLDVTEHFEAKEQATTFAIMDNKSAELANWDYPMLAETLKALHDDWVKFTGFADFEIEPLIHGTFEPKKPGDMPEHDDTDGVGNDENKGVSFWATNAQASVIRRAIDKIKDNEDDESMSDGRALELICADFSAG